MWEWKKVPWGIAISVLFHCEYDRHVQSVNVSIERPGKLCVS